MKQVVVLVHGLWVGSFIMGLLKWRLKRAGFQVVNFSYPSVRNSVQQNAALLHQFTHELQAHTIHFVGYSLGGLVTLQMFCDLPDTRPGRIVLLGTPYAGSFAARRLARHRLWRKLFGKSLEKALLGGCVAWQSSRELGVIAGTLPLGGGWLCVPSLPRPHDGAVSVAETTVPGMTAQLTLPVSHLGLVMAGKVARHVSAFLRTGQFKLDGAQASSNTSP